MARTNSYYTGSLGPNAPSRNLAFPKSANLTAVELLTFLPQYLKSADVVYRFISNGGTRSVLTAIVNTTRDLDRPWDINRSGWWMCKAMRGAGYNGWTTRTHDRWHAVQQPTWDETKINTAGFRTPSEIEKSDEMDKPILFANLGIDVRSFPQGGDALDLTRMVQYAMQNPEELWEYPTDYAELLKIVGASEVKTENTDRQVFKRWADVVPPPLSPDLSLTPKVTTQAPPKAQRKRKSVCRTASEDPTPQPKKKLGRPKKRICFKLDIESWDVEQDLWITNNDKKVVQSQEQAPEPYIRAPACLIPCTPSSTQSSVDEINFIFRTEGSAYEANPYSPYAFYGPRQTRPYRPLHLIGIPDPCDISGWAENLRWAAQQNSSFSSTGWNESPRHMQLLVKHRREQFWVSDEFLESCAREEEQIKQGVLDDANSLGENHTPVTSLLLTVIIIAARIP